MHLDQRSENALAGVHPDLVRVVHRAAERSDCPFIVTEGVRTMKRQRELVAAGASKTLRSRHLTGHAIDFAPLVGGEVTWKWPPFAIVAEAFKRAAAELGVPIVWGGDWRTFRDGPHIELDRKPIPRDARARDAPGHRSVSRGCPSHRSRRRHARSTARHGPGVVRDDPAGPCPGCCSAR
ncbi:MAG: M15 family metallopeptidase [Alphaproteobacteria bacterium]|nr:M15 family metallopeptidase [Alphaproteobacteria bacterium]